MEIVMFSHKILLFNTESTVLETSKSLQIPGQCSPLAWESWFQQMELQKGDEEPAPSAPAASVTQTFRTTCPTWQNSPSSFLLLNIFAQIVSHTQNFLKHNTAAVPQPAAIVSANTAPGGHLMVSFNVIITDTQSTFPAWS